MSGLTDENILENGKMTNKMAKVDLFMQTASYISETGLMGLRMVKENRIGKMAPNIMGTGSITPCKATVITNLLMVVCTKETG